MVTAKDRKMAAHLSVGALSPHYSRTLPPKETVMQAALAGPVLVVPIGTTCTAPRTIGASLSATAMHLLLHRRVDADLSQSFQMREEHQVA